MDSTPSGDDSKEFSKTAGSSYSSESSIKSEVPNDQTAGPDLDELPDQQAFEIVTRGSLNKDNGSKT